ncbi:hypothetical protein RchiOBHm_Chr4g0388721 [Rosa chinensis]|uniref:Uncharacterized protein n=1 Tax=Rosa chinensis TaxID=74649 RepID=A0A2P6QPT1_ROSCH|nr:hypothetical protein RchiOBHm_Chr4g0388721 [Rosa chinensis]
MLNVCLITLRRSKWRISHFFMQFEQTSTMKYVVFFCVMENQGVIMLYLVMRLSLIQPSKPTSTTWFLLQLLELIIMVKQFYLAVGY